MKKQLKYILITLAAAAVVGLVALAVVLFVPDAPADTSSAPVSQRVQIYNQAASDVVKMTVTNQYGSYDVLPKPSGNFYIDGLENYTVIQSYISTLINSYSALEAKRLISEDPEDMSIYGFEEPIASATLEFKDETKKTVIIGSAEPTTNGYYCKLDDSNAVYLLTSGIGGRLLSNKFYYIDKTITPSYNTNEELAFDRVVLSGSVRDKEIIIVPTPDNENDDYAEIFGYQIISPANAPFDLTTGNDFLTSFFVLSADSVVELSPDEATLKEYGFDNPYSTATIESSAGDFTVTVGKVDGEYCYVMNDSNDVIYKCLVTSIPWIEAQYKDVVSSMFLVPHIYLVSNVDIITPNDEYNFVLDYNENTDTVFIQRDGKYVNTENFQNLYQVLVSCYLENYTTDRSEDEPYLTIKYTFREGGTEKLELYVSPNDSRQALIKYNDKWTDFSVRMVYVDKIISDCQKLMRGESISTTW